MIPATNVKTFMLPPIVSSEAMTQKMSFDRSGSDYAVIDIFYGTNVTTTAVFDNIVVGESDTSSDPASMTAIPDLSGSLTTSTSYCFAIPALNNTSIGGIITLQMDLKKRKKYIGLSILACSTAGGTAVIGAIARLSRNEESADSAAQHDGVNLYNTAVSGCVKIVTG